MGDLEIEDMIARDADSPRYESPQQRVDRNLAELLSELRVALPGVQVLFAFLLVVPFNQRFAGVSGFQRSLYAATLLLATASSVLLIAPSFHHRFLFRQQEKEHVVLVGNTLAVVGLSLLALAMVGVVLLVSDFLFNTTVAAIAAGMVALLFAVIWYLIPLQRRLRRGRGREAPTATAASGSAQRR
jgi:hypothetical protein